MPMKLHVKIMTIFSTIDIFHICALKEEERISYAFQRERHGAEDWAETRFVYMTKESSLLSIYMSRYDHQTPRYMKK